MQNEKAEWEEASNQFFKTQRQLGILIWETKNRKLIKVYSDYLDAFGEVLHHLKPSTISP